MELTVTERLLLLSILPEQGDLTTLRIVRDLQSNLSFSEEEHEKFELVADGGAVKWNPAKAEPKVVDMGRKALDLIEAKLKEMDSKKTLTAQFLDIYDKFVENP